MAQRVVIFDSVDKKLKFKVGTQLFDLYLAVDAAAEDVIILGRDNANVTVNYDSNSVKLKSSNVVMILNGQGQNIGQFFNDFAVILGDINNHGNSTQIELNDGDRRLTIQALKINLFGKINNPSQEFADNAAAIIGGLVAGDYYYTNVAGDGIVKRVI